MSVSTAYSYANAKCIRTDLHDGNQHTSTTPTAALEDDMNKAHDGVAKAEALCLYSLRRQEDAAAMQINAINKEFRLQIETKENNFRKWKQDYDSRLRNAELRHQRASQDRDEKAAELAEAYKVLDALEAQRVHATNSLANTKLALRQEEHVVAKLRERAQEVAQQGKRDKKLLAIFQEQHKSLEERVSGRQVSPTRSSSFV